MPPLPQIVLPTVEKIYQSYVLNNGDWRRDHLGASTIGTECERALWYNFRWCSKPNFDGRVLRLFDTGNNQETRLLNDLRNIGCTVYDREPETGKQISYSEFGGHLGGSLDAIAQGFEESKVWHVVECKTVNTRGFKGLQTKGVAVAKYDHYCQVQLYMLWAKLDRAYYLCVCKETDEIYGERIHFDKVFADTLVDKANRVIFANEPLDRCEGFHCKFCNHKSICFGGGWAEVNCRTCAFSDVVIDGKWFCPKYAKEIPGITQRNGCPSHCYIPALVPLEQIDADAENWTITYAGGLVNGIGHVASKDMGTRP